MSLHILPILDLLLGWLLRLPADTALVLVAAGTATLLALVRKVTTNQDLLKRCAADRRQLAVLIRQAKCNKGKNNKDAAEAIARFKRTAKVVSLKELRQQILPLAVSIIPLALLAMWCFNRLGFIPPADNECLEFKAYFPLLRVGQFAHLVPQDGLTVKGGYIREITPAGGKKNRPYGLARWVICAAAQPKSYTLLIRSECETYEHNLLVGQPTYSQPVRMQKGDSRPAATEIRLRPYKPFTLVPGIDLIGLQPWLVGYLLITIPSLPLIKRILRIY